MADVKHLPHSALASRRARVAARPFSIVRPIQEPQPKAILCNGPPTMAFNTILYRCVGFEAWLNSSLYRRSRTVGMAVAPPLVYADQAYSIVKKKWVPTTVHSVVTPINTFTHRDSTGFSRDVCAILFVLNVSESPFQAS